MVLPFFKCCTFFSLWSCFFSDHFFWVAPKGEEEEMLSTVMYPSWVGDDLVVKLGNCYVRVLMSTCRQIDARQRQTTQESLFDTMKRREDIIQVNIWKQKNKIEILEKNPSLNQNFSDIFFETLHKMDCWGPISIKIQDFCFDITTLFFCFPILVDEDQVFCSPF